MKLISFIFIVTLAINSLKECDNNTKAMETITVKSGDTFEVVLRASPSTGYQWLWTDKEKASLVDSVDVFYKADTENLPGSPGNQTWKFKAKENGKAVIKFEYRRPWEDKSKVEETREYAIIIKK